METILIENKADLKKFLIEEILPLFNEDNWEWAEMLEIPELLAHAEEDDEKDFVFEEFPEIDDLKKMELTFNAVDSSEFPLLVNYCIGESFDRLGTQLYRILIAMPLSSIKIYNK